MKTFAMLPEDQKLPRQQQTRSEELPNWTQNEFISLNQMILDTCIQLFQPIYD